MVEDREKPDAAPETSQRIIDHIEVQVEALLGDARLTVAELRQLSAGDTLPIDRQLNEAVDLKVNGHVVARGEIVTVDDKFAVRITQVG